MQHYLFYASTAAAQIGHPSVTYENLKAAMKPVRGIAFVQAGNSAVKAARSAVVSRNRIAALMSSTLPACAQQQLSG